MKNSPVRPDLLSSRRVLKIIPSPLKNPNWPLILFHSFSGCFTLTHFPATILAANTCGECTYSDSSHWREYSAFCMFVNCLYVTIHSVANKCYTLNNRVWIILAFNRQHPSYLTPTAVSVIAIFIVKIAFIMQALIFFDFDTQSFFLRQRVREKAQFNSPNTNNKSQQSQLLMKSIQ